MSHHFDTPTAMEDPRINLSDFYLFRGPPGKVVMAMTVNPDAGVSAPDTFRDEGVYSFRFDVNNDAREEVTFKVRFGEVVHATSDDHQHVQSFWVRRATGQDAASGADGDLLIEGQLNGEATEESGIRAWAGLAPDVFAGDAAALGAFRTALYKEGRFAPEAFQHPKNFFHGRNVTAIVLEVPCDLIGRGEVRAWATVSLYGHAPEVQVSRWGFPLLTHLFMLEMETREEYNRAVPAEDATRFSSRFSQIVENAARLAGATDDPAAYAKKVIARIIPTTLPYTLDSEAAFEIHNFNGRDLADDAMDVILSVMTNTALADGVAPDKSRIRAEFPYFGVPYKASEQIGISPAHPPRNK
jgi:hypothetical protein